jgi:histidyl-tRNA synthetase
MSRERIASAPPSGMRDLLPHQVAIREAATEKILSVYRRYGFVRIETPALESLAILTRSEGGENEKLIFKVLKRGEKLESARAEDLADLGLRFDLTVPLARYYANNHARLPDPLRAIQIGPVWRAERPQKGRFRQFTQCDIDVIGLGSHVAEIELIRATADALLALDLPEPVVRINDRRVLAAMTRASGIPDRASGQVLITLDKLDKVGEAGVRKELAAQDHDEATVDRLFAVLERLTGSAGELDPSALPEAVPAGVAEALAQVMAAVRADAGERYRIRFDPTLVRGMGYYTGQIFEVSCAGYGSSVAGGGRYDDMVGRFLGRPVPACGFSIGFERITSLLEERSGVGSEGGDRAVLLVEAGLADLTRVLADARERRGRGEVVVMDLREPRKSLGRQLYELAQQGFGTGALYDARGGSVDITGELRGKRAAGAGPGA